MELEYDPQKSEANKLKHGIDFEEAKAIRDDGASIQLNTYFVEEKRFLVVGAIEQVLWTAVITYREQRIRIISVRRARDREIDAYQNNSRRV